MLVFATETFLQSFGAKIVSQVHNFEQWFRDSENVSTVVYLAPHDSYDAQNIICNSYVKCKPIRLLSAEAAKAIIIQIRFFNIRHHTEAYKKTIAYRKKTIQIIILIQTSTKNEKRIVHHGRNNLYNKYFLYHIGLNAKENLRKRFT